MNESVLYVLAGTYQQAVDAARYLPREQRWRYVDESRQLYGSRGAFYTIVGTFWDRRDASEIYDLARANGLSSVSESMSSDTDPSVSQE
jgi:hypothetical protein